MHISLRLASKTMLQKDHERTCYNRFCFISTVYRSLLNTENISGLFNKIKITIL